MQTFLSDAEEAYKVQTIQIQEVLLTYFKSADAIFDAVCPNKPWMTKFDLLKKLYKFVSISPSACTKLFYLFKDNSKLTKREWVMNFEEVYHEVYSIQGKERILSIPEVEEYHETSQLDIQEPEYTTEHLNSVDVKEPLFEMVHATLSQKPKVVENTAEDVDWTALTKYRNWINNKEKESVTSSDEDYDMNWDRSYTSFRDSKYTTPKKLLHTSILSNTLDDSYSVSDSRSSRDTKETESDAGWFDLAWDEYKQVKVKRRVLRNIKGAHRFLSNTSIFSSQVTSIQKIDKRSRDLLEGELAKLREVDNQYRRMISRSSLI